MRSVWPIPDACAGCEPTVPGRVPYPTRRARFDADDALAIVSSVFPDAQAERWDARFYALATRDEVRAYCRHNYIPLERAERVEIPLWLTKRGVLVTATKT